MAREAKICRGSWCLGFGFAQPATLEQVVLSGSAGDITAGGRVGLAGERALDLTVDGTINIAALSLLSYGLIALGEGARLAGGAAIAMSVPVALPPR